MALPVTDTWSSGTTQDLAAYGAYTALEGGLEVISGSAGVRGTVGGYNTYRRNDETFDADQYSQVVMTSAWLGTGGEYGGPAVRCQNGANTSYHVDTGGSDFYLSKALAGTQSTLVGPVAISLAAGDVIRLEVTGTGGTVTLKVFKALAASPTSFTQVGTDYTDSSSPITTAGQAGVFVYNNNTSMRLGAWEAGNLGGGGSSPVLSAATPSAQRNRRHTGRRF
jgi:hypothetical protein